jgi:hypothetical protein
MLDKGDIKTDFDVACILKEIYKYDYKCSSIQKVFGGNLIIIDGIELNVYIPYQLKC